MKKVRGNDRSIQEGNVGPDDAPKKVPACLFMTYNGPFCTEIGFI